MSHAATLLQDAALRPVTRGIRRLRLLRWVLMGGGIIVVAVGALVYWLNGGRYASTDDAYLQADDLTLSTDVSGIVADIPVREGEAVKQGQVLFRLDPLKFQIALDNAEANLAQTRLNLDAMQADYQAALRDAAAKQAQVSSDQANYDRFAALVKQQRRDPTGDGRRALQARRRPGRRWSASNMQARAQLAKLAGKPGLPVEQMPAYQQAEAQVAEAQRELDHAIVRAPYDGIVTQVNKLQPGMFLPAGTAAFGFVSTQHLWVEARAEGDRADLGAARRPRDRDDRRLSRPHLGRRGAERRPRHRPAILRAAGREFLGQLGEGGATAAGAHRIRPPAGRSAAVGRHEREVEYRHRPHPLLADLF